MSTLTLSPSLAFSMITPLAGRGLILFAGLPWALNGAGFAIAEQSVSGLGYGFAGASAVAEDASTIWHNPAGLTYVPSAEVLLGVHGILPQAKFRNAGTGTFHPGTGALVPTSGVDDTSDTGALIPNFYFAQPLGEDWVLGAALNVPFGLKTEYDPDWVGRYVAVESDLKTVNGNLSLAYRVSPQWSVGGGVNLMQAEAVLSNAIDFGLVLLAQSQPGGPIPAAALPPGLVGDVLANRGTAAYDGFVHLEGDDRALGWNLGALWEPRPGTRIGAHYRSKVALTLRGETDFRVPGTLQPLFAAAFADQGGSVDLTLPASFSLSLSQRLNAALTLLADYTWTDWSEFESLLIRYDNPSPPDSLIPEYWADTSRYSVGLRCQYNEGLVLRAGLVYDEAAVGSPRYRSPRIPDADRIWVAVGAQFAVTEAFILDAAYAHVFVKDGEIANDTHTPGQVLVGETESKVDIVSVSGRYTF